MPEYTITLSDEEAAGVTWAANNSAVMQPGVPPPTPEEYLDSQVHLMVRPWMLRAQADAAPAPAAHVAEAYLAAPLETQTEVITLLGVEPASSTPAMVPIPTLPPV